MHDVGSISPLRPPLLCDGNTMLAVSGPRAANCLSIGATRAHHCRPGGERHTRPFERIASSALSRKSRLYAFGNHLRLMLGKCGEDVDCESVGMRVVAGYKVDTACQELRSNENASCETIDPSDDERRSRPPGVTESSSALWPISEAIPSSRLDFFICNNDGGALPIGEGGYGGALSGHAKAISTLALRTHT